MNSTQLTNSTKEVTNSTKEVTTSRGMEEWTEEEFDEVLYKWDNDTDPVIEYRYQSSIKRTIALHPVEAPTSSPWDATKNQKIGDNNPPIIQPSAAYLNIPISGDDVHIVEFYAPWCPHCQNFKPVYIALAKEITKRSINVNVFFHAVSCTLNSDVCTTYNIAGYPTFLAYRGKTDLEGDDDGYSLLVHNTSVRGTELELDHNLNEDIEVITDVMKFDVSSIERNFSRSESKYSNSTDQKNYLLGKIQRGKEVAEEKIEYLEYDVSINDIYHDAILSLAYILRHGIYYQSSGTLLQDEAQKAALNDFLKLVHWSTPRSWGVRKNFIDMLVENFDSVVTQGKGRLNDFVERQTSDIVNHGHGMLPWGYIDANDRKGNQNVVRHRHGLGQDAPLHLHHHDEVKQQTNPKKWTENCNHGPSSSGFTCKFFNGCLYIPLVILSRCFDLIIISSLKVDYGSSSILFQLDQLSLTINSMASIKGTLLVSMKLQVSLPLLLNVYSLHPQSTQIFSKRKFYFTTSLL